MDKIIFSDWNNVFGTTEQRILFASERYSDTWLRFEEPGLVSGFVQSVSTPGMMLTEFSIHADGSFQLIDPHTQETAESVFVLDGGAESHFHNLSSSQVLNKNYHNFQYNHQFGGEHTIHSGDFHALTITYQLDFLRQLLQTDDSSCIGQLGNHLYGQKPWMAGEKALSFQGRLAEVIGSIRRCPFNGVTKYLYLESKMMELFVLQMEQAQAILERKNDDANWSVADRNKLHEVKNYIENAYLDAFNLKDLTYKFGLNEFKLKKGYRQLFQTTVFGHVHQLRMQKAKTLLEEKAMNVSETAFFIGYNNVASFCTEFKKRFGCSPGKIAF
jgi:AraC family transcriptional regulator, transcriptional activator of the genes for pyochelin and ferripyochelin receptors